MATAPANRVSRTRRAGLACGAAAMLLALLPASRSVRADEFPSHPIRMLQGFPAGGNADIIARAIGEEMSRILGQPFIFEARPGAGGNLASDLVAKATPDGYTLVLLTTAHVIGPAMLKAQTFDPVSDFAFVSKVFDYPFFFAVPGASRYKTLGDLVADAKARPGALTWGSAGVGSGQQMCGELFALAAGIKMVHVPFRGDAGSVTALLSSSIDFIVAPSTVLEGNIAGGNFRALAVSSKVRAPGLPDVPTLTEALGQDVEMQAMAGIATTKGTPPAILEKLNATVRRAVASPAVDKRLREMGGTPAATSSAEMATWVAAQVKRWKEVAEAAGLQKR